MPLASFTPEVREWFLRSFEEPTAAQLQAWPAISRGDNVLLSAPTGSGKTLAAFLWALDQLEELAARPLQRVGLSATQRPLEEVARFLCGPSRPCTVIDTGQRKPLDLEIRVPVDDMREPDSDSEFSEVADGVSGTRRSIWPAIYPELLDLVKPHRSTIVFVHNRRRAE